jgi:hypothetical protein
MLEYWNYGIMGSGKMELCSIGGILIARKKDNKIRSFEDPIFQSSIIPLFHQQGKKKYRKKWIFSII